MTSRRSILIVDDDRDFCGSLRNVLTAAGFDAVTAEDGFQGLVQLARRRFDALVVDLMMPRLDGMGVVSALLGPRSALRPPVIVLISAHLEIERRFSGPHVQRVLLKPFEPVELVDSLARAFAATGAAT